MATNDTENQQDQLEELETINEENEILDEDEIQDGEQEKESEYEEAEAEEEQEQEQEQEIAENENNKRITFDGTTPTTTIFESMYEPTVLEPWRESNRVNQSTSDRRISKSVKDASINLTDNNANEFSNLSHVGWKGRVDYAIEQYYEEKGRKLATQTDIANDPNKLLSIATSTIILMAKRSKKIPKENFMYTELYLKGVTDEYGDNPPNIKNLLKHIQYYKRKNEIDWGTKVEREVPRKLVVAKINKQSRIPVRIKKNDEFDRKNGGMEIVQPTSPPNTPNPKRFSFRKPNL